MWLSSDRVTTLSRPQASADGEEPWSTMPESMCHWNSQACALWTRRERLSGRSIARSEQGPLRHLNNCPRGEATAMLHKGNDEYLPLQANIICLLLFFVSVL